MKTKSFLTIFFFVILQIEAFSQRADWERDVQGKLFPVTGINVPGMRIQEVFKIINRIPAISHPKGFNVKQWYETNTKAKNYSARLHVNFYHYYSFDKGPVQLQSSHPLGMSIYINDPKILMNEQSIVFSEETNVLKLPVMFSDTFNLVYKMTNGYNVGHGIDTEFDRNNPIYVLNPMGLSFFRPITQEEYLRFFIGKLELDIEKDKKRMEENKTSMAEMANNAMMKTMVPELEVGQKNLKKWIDFLKEKKQSYEKKLSEFSPAEKQAPASYALHIQSAQIIGEDGNYVEKLTGHIPYEPAEEGTDAFIVKPLYTYNKEPFNSKYSKTTFQIIVVREGFSVDDSHEIKSFLAEHFYPLLDFKEIAALMFR